MGLELPQRYSKPEAIMPFVMKLLQLVGLQGAGRDGRARHILCVAPFVFVCVIPSLFGGHPDVDHYVRASVEFIFNCNIFVGSLMFGYTRTNFVAFVAELRDLAEYACSLSFKLKNTLSRFNRQIDRLARAHTAIMACIAVIYWVLPLPRIYWSYFTQANTSDPVIHLLQHIEVKFYWLENRSSMADYTIFVVIMLPFVCLCSAVNNVKLLTTSCSIRYCTIFTKVTIMAVEQLDGLSSQEQICVELSKVAIMHRRLLRCIHLLEKTLSPIMLLQWSLCILNWSVTLLYLNSTGINMKSVTVIVMFSLITLETLLYCVLGAHLTAKAEELERALYARRWYDLPVGLQKNVLFMLSRAQRPVAITVGKFFHMNLEEFSRMVNLSYSAYVVLKDQIKLDTLD